MHFFGQASEEAADGVRGPTHRLGDLRTAGALAAAQHGENLGALCIPRRPSLLPMRGRGRSPAASASDHHHLSAKCIRRRPATQSLPLIPLSTAIGQPGTAAIGRCGGWIVAGRGEGEHRAGCVRKLVRFVGHDEAPESRPDHRALLPGRAPPAEPGRGGGTQLVRLRARLSGKRRWQPRRSFQVAALSPTTSPRETSSGARSKCSVLEALRSARMGSISFLQVMKIVRAEPYMLQFAAEPSG
jgi:hypothetical protein